MSKITGPVQSYCENSNPINSKGAKMAITDITNSKWIQFLAAGGELVVEIDKEDIVKGNEPAGEFEASPEIAARLESGFQLVPSEMMLTSEVVAAATQYGDDWTYVTIQVYSRGGTITYRKLPTGRFAAMLALPVCT